MVDPKANRGTLNLRGQQKSVDRKDCILNILTKQKKSCFFYTTKTQQKLVFFLYVSD